MKSLKRPTKTTSTAKYLWTFSFMLPMAFSISIGLAQNQSNIDSLQVELEATNEDSTRAKIYNQLAYEFTSSDSATAVSHAMKAIEFSEKSTYSKGIADAYFYIATVNRIRGYLEEAEKWMNKSKVYSDSVDLKIEFARAVNGLATISSTRREFENALQLLDQAQKIYEELNDEKGLGSIYMEYGIINKNRSNYEEALRYYQKALDINLKLKNQHSILRCYYNMANVYVQTGNLDGGLKNFLKAANIANDIGDHHAEAVCYSVVGQVFHQQGDPDQALEYYYKAQKMSEETGNKLEILSLKFKIGNVYLTKNEIEKARKLFQDGLKLSIELNNKTYETQAYSFIGDAHYRSDEYAEALNYFEKATVNYRAFGDKGSLSHLLVYMGDIYRRLEQFNNAKRVLKEGIEIAKEINYPIAIRDGLDVLSQVEKALGNTGAAYDAHVSFKEVYDSLRNDEVTKNIARLQAEFEFEQEKDSIAFEQQKANLAFEEELERKELMIQGSLAGGVLVFIILILLYRSYLIKQRKNSELRHKNEIIEIKNDELQARNKEITVLRETEREMAAETIALKERELTTVTMLSHEKNTLLHQLGEQIGQLSSKVDEDVIPDLKEIKRTIKTNLNAESWSMFMYQFEKVHPSFFSQLKDEYSKLTQHDLRLCAYLKVGMDNKEIASVSNITTDAVKKSINRLKKKMNLDIEIDLREFLIKL